MGSGQGHNSARSADTVAPEAQEFDEILYHITHDLRSALRAMKTLPGWLREDLTSHGVTPTTSVLEILEMIETQADRADRMLLDLRTFSRIGRASDDPSVMTLREAIDGAAEQVRIPAGFRIDCDLRVNAVRAPRNDLRELFAVLLSNAVTHHDADIGRITIEAHTEDDAAILSVTDDGPGIPERFRERVFSMMATLRPRDECPGSGLGLSIARKIVTKMGGTVTIDDVGQGRGTRVRIALPSSLVVAVAES